MMLESNQDDLDIVPNREVDWITTERVLTGVEFSTSKVESSQVLGWEEYRRAIAISSMDGS